MNLWKPGKDFLSGCKFVSKKFLDIGIVFAGATLGFQQVLGTGSSVLPMLVLNIIVAFIVAFLFGRKLGVSRNTSSLVGSGTAICGGTAIATIAAVIRAKEEEIAYALAAIFLFDLLAATVFPYAATGFGLSSVQTGFLLGGAVNDTASVIAAEATYNILNGTDLSLALTVKLTRTILLVVIAVVFAFMRTKEQNKEQSGSFFEFFPWVVVIFLVMVILNSAQLFKGFEQLLALDSGSLGKYFKIISKFFTTAALCGVGFKMKFQDIIREGTKPVLLGGAAWVAVTISTVLYIAFL